jgi:aldehyde dehydrogenase (NAD+)
MNKQTTSHSAAETASRSLKSIAARIGLEESKFVGGDLDVFSPIDGELIGSVTSAGPEVLDRALDGAQDAFRLWRTVPAPRRGELVRRLGDELRSHKDALGDLVTLEVGKITSEGRGEVQEMIDVCDFAVGLSRQLYGATMTSERAGHRLMEQWHPIGPVGVVTAFNFPVAVWAWNAALALVCGDPVIWKPSEKAPLCALACHAILERVIEEAEPEFAGKVGRGLSSIILGDRSIGSSLVADDRVPVLSATGSTQMGKVVGETVARRFGRSILELGGNNAMIVCPSAEMDLAVRATVFSAVGTAGQRCTSLRRLLVHTSVRDEIVESLGSAYDSVEVGDPRDAGTLMGPLIDRGAFDAMQGALDEARSAGATVIGGDRIADDRPKDAFYVRPSLVLLDEQLPVVKRETFAPILYVMPFGDLEEAISLQNDVPQGLSSSIFTTDMREAERFLSASGSDCGIANVNAGPSGAEIGGAFGGEKATGGGRESGSDSWKGYMRRQTATINYSGDLPLAQGVRFDLDGETAKKP